jgi:hypothetical protein
LSLVISPRISSTPTNAARRLTSNRKSVILARPYRFPKTVSCAISVVYQTLKCWLYSP